MSQNTSNNVLNQEVDYESNIQYFPRNAHAADDFNNEPQSNISLKSVSGEKQEIKNLWRIKAVNPQSIIELRAIKQSETITKLFRGKDYNSVDELCLAFEQEALMLNAEGFNIYVVMNPINDSFVGGSARDKDIQFRDLLLIDIDRHKTRNAANELIPANGEELEAARLLAEKVSAYLKEGGWDDPAVVMSGNGYHLYYILDNVANSDETRDAIQDFLKGLASAFDTEVVKIDTSVFNASRITKVVGTIVRKGKDSADRPYRIARCV